MRSTLEYLAIIILTYLFVMSIMWGLNNPSLNQIQMFAHFGTAIKLENVK